MYIFLGQNDLNLLKKITRTYKVHKSPISLVNNKKGGNVYHKGKTKNTNFSV